MNDIAVETVWNCECEKYDSVALYKLYCTVGEIPNEIGVTILIHHLE